MKKLVILAAFASLVALGGCVPYGRAYYGYNGRSGDSYYGYSGGAYAGGGYGYGSYGHGYRGRHDDSGTDPWDGYYRPYRGDWR